jgi:hypothetical protein
MSRNGRAGSQLAAGIDTKKEDVAEVARLRSGARKSRNRGESSGFKWANEKLRIPVNSAPKKKPGF